MKIGIIGFNTHNKEVFDYVKLIISELDQNDEIVVSGGRGVESNALRFAKDRKIKTHVVTTDYHARNTPHALLAQKRDHDIIDQSDRVYVFDNDSERTNEARKYAIRVGKLSRVFGF